jgi:orotidine-5'-phosphate decarboxylase
MSLDGLIEAISATGNPSVVGLDPTPALLPSQFLGNEAYQVGDGQTESADSAARLAKAYLRFNEAVMQGIQGIVPAVKPQIAMYEALGAAGIQAYIATCSLAQSMGFYVLGDIKRGDIGSTAAAYAGHLSGIEGVSESSPWHEDGITVNPYLGSDGILPFVDAAKKRDKDVFVLVRTSNPSSDEIQELALTDGRKVYECVADLVNSWGDDSIAAHGYSRVGAVVGATHPKAGQALRRRMPHTFFLIPGFGAQGGSADDVAAMFDAHGSGAVVNSSRGIIGSWRKNPEYDTTLTAEDAFTLVSGSSREAALSMKEALRHALSAQGKDRT